MGNLAQRFPYYSSLLRLYPAPYQKQYGEQMLQTLADMLDDPAQHKAAVWLRAVLDLPFSLTKQNLMYAGDIMKHDTPNYVKWNSTIGAVLLLPFFAALAANGLNRVIYDRDLYHSWLWRTPVVFTWVLVLPVAAALITLISLLVYLYQRERSQHTGWIKGLLDFRHDWPLLLVAILAVSIVGMVRFHDSVHCLTGNPVRETTHFSRTWRCIQAG